MNKLLESIAYILLQGEYSSFIQLILSVAILVKVLSFITKTLQLESSKRAIKACKGIAIKIGKWFLAANRHPFEPSPLTLKFLKWSEKLSYWSCALYFFAFFLTTLGLLIINTPEGLKGYFAFLFVFSLFFASNIYYVKGLKVNTQIDS
ncbi:hypothetical protein [Fodinibius saliphilus]|uniref:hypothetical protein n=1 Tax=Fodinibius saliphilus TaxID=1920650 RepID=UPI001107F8C3|nr:hypothetical protein [Fodinibius saliphilus]